MPTLSRRVRMPAVAVVFALLLATVPFTSAAVAQPEGRRVAAPLVRVQADRRVQPLEPVRVLVVRLTKARPVTISWGDGTMTRVRTTCSAVRAVRQPRACGAMSRHRYAEPGAFRIVVTRRPATAYRALLRVAEPSVATETPAVGTATWREDMIAQVNALREQAGVAPVTLCASLTGAAQDYAHLMAAQDYYGHVGPDGSQPWDRISSHGYAWRGAGENIAAGYDTTSDVMSGWRDSHGHYANLVNPSYTHIGLGRATNPTSTYHSYWVQDFGYGGSCELAGAA